MSSDSNAFAAHTREVLFLADAEIAVIKANEVDIYDASQEVSSKGPGDFKWND